MKSNALADIHGRSFITPRPWSEAEFDELLLKDSTFLISGENSFLLGMLTDYEAEILTLAVDPMKRRLGIAKKMLDEFEDRCLEKKINKIKTNVIKMKKYILTVRLIIPYPREWGASIEF